MQISVEMSLYPLADVYLEQITDTVERLAQATDVEVVTNQMSTQITGEFEAVMSVVKSELLTTFKEQNLAVMVCKFLNKSIEL